MNQVSFPVFEGFKRVLLMLVVILFCVLAWMVLSVIAGQTVHHQPEGIYTVYMGERLIGSH